ncbi:diguanylate cyclase/phosphodiesterase (GGDEF & EAL domains) with PAS/PAC sensor(s) [hydrothermal vent metagenome]|uniref:Diguanylate cyclase/phosphodiesterase (GGDEF & EAL domains) with PAS/PAC sensor(S) n=1 Tax=hydrothermal vent metagenome TaxID=652676 RepID=A0A1W1C2C3_9ZZZZ
MKQTKTDILTGLYTYNVLVEHLEKKLASATDLSTGILYFEIDDPARFNDLFGYNSDKEILLKLSKNISNLLDDELFIRMGTYSFAIVKDHIEDTAPLMAVAKKIINLVREPMSFNGNLLYLTVAIGITTSSKEDTTPQMLISRAENGMKESKQQGTNRISINHETATLSYEHEFKLLHDLPHAIENGEIYFVYQAQYNYDQSAFIGAEVLARWEHPELGNIPPNIFIPLAEKNGMITPLMIKTLTEVSSLFHTLDAEQIKPFSIAVNLSFQVFMEESFLDTVTFLLDAYNLKGRPLTFEIMEDTIPDHLESFTTRLKELKSLGFSLAVDDYGTGHTSLTYLLHFPIDYLKIDRSFVHHIHLNKKDYLLFKSIVDMAKILGLKVIAEGVETKEDDKIIRQFEDITVQGYLYSKPLKTENLIELLKEDRNK